MDESEMSSVGPKKRIFDFDFYDSKYYPLLLEYELITRLNLDFDDDFDDDE